MNLITLGFISDNNDFDREIVYSEIKNILFRVKFDKLNDLLEVISTGSGNSDSSKLSYMDYIVEFCIFSKNKFCENTELTTIPIEWSNFDVKPLYKAINSIGLEYNKLAPLIQKKEIIKKSDFIFVAMQNPKWKSDTLKMIDEFSKETIDLI